MKVNVKCFSTLADAETCDYAESTSYELQDGDKVHDLLGQAGIRGEDVKIAFVNGRKVALDTTLSEGDRVGLAPATGGM